MSIPCATEAEAQKLVREHGGFYYSQAVMNRAVCWTLGIGLPLVIGILALLMINDPAFRGLK